MASGTFGIRLLSFASSGLDRILGFLHPRLAPWAAFFRRFAAGLDVGLCGFPQACGSVITDEVALVLLALKHGWGVDLSAGEEGWGEVWVSGD
jgi:hypothetical protein